MDVEVHQARGDHEVAVVQHQLVASAAGRLRFGPALDRHDPAAVHAHCCRECTPRGHHSVAEHEVLGLVSQQAAGQRPRVAGSGPGREDALRREREAHHEDLNNKDDQEATRRVASHILLLLGAAVPIGLAICIAGRPRASGSQPRAPPRHRARANASALLAQADGALFPTNFSSRKRTKLPKISKNFQLALGSCDPQNDPRL
mmetsp:Transcript_184/g.693  ORF Transcript_184/g.693 Transcript_184/m.693 type:complete len:203 (+) Transcript_184:857-1465(+)